MKNLVEELRWRGLIHDVMPGTEEQLLKEATSAYIGFDPTSDSLHIGSLVPIILLMHLRKFGHRPIALVGGATGMIGDPSGKSNERNLLDEATLNHNVNGIKSVLSRFLDFDATDATAPVLVNNYDWMKDFSFIEFAREVGKRITVNYMMTKDSVKKRLSGEEGGEGMSFTEFTYQLIQGYDFYHLNKEYNCLLQMGGSDQWGNITTGTELVRRMNVDNEERAKAFGMTCPLITKADGSKFGKSEGGNVWLDAEKTSPYKFYQFWLNTTDVDAEKYIKIFTFLDQETVEKLIAEHNEAPHLRILQKKLAEELTLLVHTQEDLESAIFASNAFFSKDMTDLRTLNEKQLVEIFEGIPQAEVAIADLNNGIDIVTLLNEKAGFLASNGEARRALKENSISVNKEKVTEEFSLTSNDLVGNKFVLLQRGKKNYFVVKFENAKESNIKQKPNKYKAVKAAVIRRGGKLKSTVQGFVNEKKYYEMSGRKDFIVVPGVNVLIDGFKIFNVVSEVNGVILNERIPVRSSKTAKKMGVSKSAQGKLRLRKNDNVEYEIDNVNKTIKLKTKL